jgi:hypothetical protein
MKFVSNAHRMPGGFANDHLGADQDGLTLIDTELSKLTLVKHGSL